MFEIYILFEDRFEINIYILFESRFENFEHFVIMVYELSIKLAIG